MCGARFTLLSPRGQTLCPARLGGPAVGPLCSSDLIIAVSSGLAALASHSEITMRKSELLDACPVGEHVLGFY